MAKVLVLGLGISGSAAVSLLLKQKHEVVGIDSDGDCGVDVRLFDLLVVSPGVAPSHPLYLAARSSEIEIIGEAELAFRHLKQPCLAVTGTNGKTTTTLMAEHVLRSCGIKARALGNVGIPLTTYAMNPGQEEVIIAELSSFQLETMSTPAFDAGVILNITPDHLDRYDSLEDYAKAKCRLQLCMKENAPLYVSQSVLSEYASLLREKRCALLESIECFLPLSYRQGGEHEKQNARAVWGLVKGFGISEDAFSRSLESFKKPPHRIEFIKKVDGVSYYDDSKGTNIDAVLQAVRTMPGEVILIAGGVDKGASYAPWKQEKFKQIIAIGQAAEKIRAELEGTFPVALVKSMEEAVLQASQLAKEGDCVLLSPGCSSYDMFSDYAHRGREFQMQVHHLEETRRKQ
jgi:UDP-N-acetylmuramoylalanine--D-glutamate ligase